MKPVQQTKLSTENQKGNCLAACFASIFEIEISDVPQFENLPLAQWRQAIGDWLKSKGFAMQIMPGEWHLPGYLINVGTSPRGKTHAVIMKNGELDHDPHPDGGGLSEITCAYLLYPLDPTKAFPRPPNPLFLNSYDND